MWVETLKAPVRGVRVGKVNEGVVTNANTFKIWAWRKHLRRENAKRSRKEIKSKWCQKVVEKKRSKLYFGRKPFCCVFSSPACTVMLHCKSCDKAIISSIYCRHASCLLSFKKRQLRKLVIIVTCAELCSCDHGVFAVCHNFPGSDIGAGLNIFP